MSFTVDDNNYFKLYYDCIPVKGYARSIICDVTRHYFDFIPNALYYILTECTDKNLKTIFDSFDSGDRDTLGEYFTFLFDKEYIFWCTKEELQLFPATPLKFETPSIIDNCIVDVNGKSDHNWKEIVFQLNELGCSNLQIRIFETHGFDYCSGVLKLFENSMIKNIEILLPFCNEANDKEFLLQFSKDHLRLSKLILHSATYEKTMTITDTLTNIVVTTQVVNSDKCCGIVNPVFFTVDRDFFAESLSFNTCLNKKISIDAFGYIKNCPSINENFGHTGTTTLKSVVGNVSFLKKWKLKKDEIKICMDCEFRHICPDCRAFKENPGDEFSKPLKCGYDPYTGVWEKNKSEMPGFAKTIDFYQLKNIAF